MDKRSQTIKAIRLADKNFWNQLPESGGVYFIHSFNDKAPLKINRVLKVDDRGILYIGKSENIRERLRMLWRVINPQLKAKAHTFGIKYNDNKNLRKAFPLESLIISYKTTNESKKIESKLLNQYFAKFGEVPPLNSSK